jgi:branched-chain amino acid transport system substrate-binding protein
MKLILCSLLLTSSLLLALPSASAAEPIRVGGLFDLSGKAQHIGGPTRDVAQMIVDRINKNGGLKGRPLELVVADTQSEPSQAVVALKRLVSKDKVVAVIGPTTTGAAMACLGAIDEAKIPMVACVGGDAPVNPARKWVFKSPQRTSTAVERLYTHLKAKGFTQIGLLCADDKFGQEGEAYLKSMADKFGLKIVAQELFAPTDADMTVQLAKVAAAKPTALVVWTIGPAGAIVTKNARQAGLKTPLFQCHGQPDSSYVKLAGDAANESAMPSTKVMVADQLPASDRQRTVVQDFVRAYQEKGIGNLGTHSGYAWDAIQLVVNALDKAGTDPEALRQAIENTKDYVGVSGVYNLSASDHCGLGLDSLVIVQVKDGKWKLIE